MAERPRELLIKQLEQRRMSKMRSLDCPRLLNYTSGIEKFNECPEGVAKGKISQETFKREA
ncbi:unnamed protein product [Coregonus sp. 'balchen']|nr:unnamed protein product [Coregonus sp. 'balchen']